MARRIRDAGLAVSGYCRSTYIPAATEGFPENVATIAAPSTSRELGAASSSWWWARCRRPATWKTRAASLPKAPPDAGPCPVGRRPAVAGTVAPDVCRRPVLSQHPGTGADLCEAIEPARRRPGAGRAVDLYHLCGTRSCPNRSPAPCPGRCSHSMCAIGWCRPRHADRPRHDGRRRHRHPADPGHGRGGGHEGAVEVEISPPSTGGNARRRDLAVCAERLQTVC